MAEQAKGPTAYFPSIEKTYGRTIGEWLKEIENSGVSGHKPLVDWLKAEHGLGHGHANALVAYQLNPGKWPEYPGAA
ncbi:DUF4287 domain-containing protein [Glycomyces dulcitolivorans]|uniref:DUF4287 domain-containing protein n=1 Tax=Glycomyces dulcitolivorans TaxID=2200759 RepID=UPI000DD45063|nr:DUF4287 domain-containing protein [Glycomyces dulcitolivorans]